MGRVSASIQVPGRAADAEALWYDPMRWAAWLDGFAHASKVPEEWPAGGTLSLEYELKEQHAFTPLVDRLFIRRELTGSLQRSLAGFARERRGDMELEDELGA
jgi:hypothetical protein